jgi:hypothetical protein
VQGWSSVFAKMSLGIANGSMKNITALLIFISLTTLLISCTTVHVIEAGKLQTKYYPGFIQLNILASERGLSAVNQSGTGLMLTDSQFVLGYFDVMQVKKNAAQDHCEVIVLIENQQQSLALLTELQDNPAKYSNICALSADDQ